MLVKSSSRFILLLIFLWAFALASPVQAARVSTPAFQEGVPAVPGELVMQFQPGTDEGEVARTATKTGATLQSYDPDSGLALFVLGDSSFQVDQATVYSALDASDKAIFAEPNYIYSLDPLPSDLVDIPARPESRTVSARDMYTGQEHQVTLEIPPLSALEIDTADAGDPIEVQSTSWNKDAYPQWGWGWIDTEVVWPDKTKAYEVAVLDTGVDTKHPDLKGVVVSGTDWVNNDKASLDDHGHGTHVSGIIAAKTNDANKNWPGGIPGVSNGKIYAVKVIDAQGFGTSYDIAMGLYQAANRLSVKVINMSLGGGYSSIIQDAVEYAISKGKLLVVSAGNGYSELVCDGLGGDGDVYPACLSSFGSPFTENMIVVAASGYDINSNDVLANNWAEASCKASYTNYGGYVDIIAPGTSIYSTMPTYPVEAGSTWNSDGYAYGYMSGTSMAAPHVAGAAARTWAEFPLMTAAEVRTQLLTESLTVADDTSCGTAAWPDGAVYGASERPFLWMPGAMQQAILVGDVYDASTGAAIPSTSVQAVRAGVTVSQDKTCTEPLCDVYSTYSTYRLRAIPVSDTLPISIRFSEKTHTAGYQTYYSGYLTGPGYWTTASDAFLPEKGKKQWSFVTTWSDWYSYDLDGYLFMSDAVPYIVWVGPRSPYGITNIYYGTGGELTTIPYARVMYDSWYSSQGLAVDSIDLQLNPGTSKPYYPGDYTFIVANNWDSDGAPPAPVADVFDACAYVWLDGVIKYGTCLDSSSTAQFWIIGALNGTVFTPATANTVVNDYWNYNGGWVFSDSLGVDLRSGPIPLLP